MTKTIIVGNLIISLIILSLIVGCKNKQEPKIYNYSNSLIVLENAEETFYGIRDGGSIQLSYKIRADYPAEHVIKEVSDQLGASGWKPLKEDHLNPGLLSSHVEGWSDFEDASRPPPRIVHQWMGDWEDKYGNIIRYAFVYEYPKNKEKKLSLLQVHAIYTPASLVNLIKEKLNIE